MKTFIYGTIFGIVLATIKVDGVVKLLDHGVVALQQFVTELDHRP